MRRNGGAKESRGQKVQRITGSLVPPDWLHDLNVLRRIVSRARVVNKPVKRFLSAGEYPPPDFKIATVSTNVGTEDLSPIRKRDYSLWVMRDKVRDRLQAQYLEHLRTAAQAGAKLICMNELAYPSPTHRDQDAAFQNQVRRLVNEYGVFLIGGSYHDPRTSYSITPVFSPSAEVLYHAKLTSAVKVFEFVRSPSPKSLTYYETPFGSFTILVGLDVYNPEFVLRLMMLNWVSSQEEKINVVFVPSFSVEKGASMADVCRDLSYVTACLVVYVNCAAGEPRQAAYLAGELLPTAKAGRRRAGISSSWSISKNVVLHEITYGDYHKSRIDVTHGYSWIFDFLIGEKEGAHYSIST